MELRHLRYFIGVAEEGSFTHAEVRRLHTTQPSLSRQIRELGVEVGARLLERKVRGIALTAAGRVFLDHARLALLQIEAAAEAARRAERPPKPAFVAGFLIGQEVAWLPETLRILREEAVRHRDHDLQSVFARARGRADARADGCGISAARAVDDGPRVQIPDP